MKKLLSFFFSTLQGGVRGGLLLLLLVTSVSAIYASDTQVDGIWYDFDSSTKTASVTYRGNSYGDYDGEYSGAVVIPETVTYYGITYSVTSIGYRAFYDCSSLTSVTIGESVTSIGEDAFYNTGIYNNKSNWESKVLYIDNCLIDAEGSISGAYTIKENTRLIANYAFAYCTSLTSVTIPNSVTSIGGHAFEGCTSLTSVTIGENVTSIGGWAFYECFSLTSVTIPNSVTSIGYGAFTDCSSLATVTLTANSVEEFCKSQGNGLLYEAYVTCRRYIQIDGKDIIEITIPNGVTSIGDYAFYGCSSLTSITIPNSVTSIGNGAFLACSLTSVTIPNSVTSIGNSAFRGCSALDSVVWNAKNYTNFSKKENAPFYDSRSQIKSFTFGEAVERIPAYLCTGMNMLTSITIPNSVTSIGKGAFEGCVQLEKLTLGSAVKNIAANAFAGCNRLYHIYCYPTNPPVADQSSFSNYNVYLYVPCDYKEEYDLDIFWGNFKYIECIESEDVSTNGVVITPSTNDVTITWPAEAGADTYTIVIKKGNEVFCTLTFNADGQLLNIAYAPGRDSNNHGAQYAEQAGNGYRFTVTGLEEGAHYTYNIDVRDAANKTIKSYSGEFTAESMTAVENITTNNANIQKILRDGQLLILRDGVEYTIMGQEL